MDGQIRPLGDVAADFVCSLPTAVLKAVDRGVVDLAGLVRAELAVRSGDEGGDDDGDARPD